MDISVIQDWILRTRGEYFRDNCFHDFVYVYYDQKNEKIRWTAPIADNSNECNREMYLVRKIDMHIAIRPMYGKLEMDQSNVYIEHSNPFNSAALYLYRSADNVEKYLKMWLFLLLREKGKDYPSKEDDIDRRLYDAYNELRGELSDEYHVHINENTKHMLPSPEPDYHYESVRHHNDSVEMRMYEYGLRKSELFPYSGEH